MVRIIKEFQMGPSSREAFVSDLSRDDAARFNQMMADMYGEDAYYDDLTKEEWNDLKRAFYGQLRLESKKSRGKKVTESFFREEFYNWYDSFSSEEQEEIEQYMEDEGMPDMVSDLSRTDMENIMSHFDDEHLDYLLDQEDEGRRIVGGWRIDYGPDEELDESLEDIPSDEKSINKYLTLKHHFMDHGDNEHDAEELAMKNMDKETIEESSIYKKTEASRMDNEFYGGGSIYVGLYGDDCGTYSSLEEFKSALKKAGIKILDVSGDEEYGWDMTIKGIAKEIYKLVDGRIPGYDCDDVMEFIEQYSLDPEELKDHDVDLYSAERLSKDIPDEAFESVSKKTESRPRLYWESDISEETGDRVYLCKLEGDTDNLNISEDNVVATISHYDNDGDYYYRVRFRDRDIEKKAFASCDYDRRDLESVKNWVEKQIRTLLLKEDTVRKSNGKWTNKGKNGEHGEFKTKKAADKQRKAMFANGYKGESNELSFTGNKRNRVSEEELDNYPEGTMIKFKSINGDRVITIVKDGDIWKNKDPRFNKNLSSKEMSEDLFGIRYFDIYYPREYVGARDEMDESVGKKTESFYDAPSYFLDFYDDLDDKWKRAVDNLSRKWFNNECDDEEYETLIDVILTLQQREENGDDILEPVSLFDPENGEKTYKIPLSLFESYGDSLRDAPNPYEDEDEEYSDFGDGSVRRGESFVADGIEYKWVDEASDVYYLDFDAWQVWKACSEENEEAYFVVDKDTGFIDWGPCDTEMEAIEFLYSKIDDYNNDVDEDDLMDGLLDESADPSQKNALDVLWELNEIDGYRVEKYLEELGCTDEEYPDLSTIPLDIAEKVVAKIKKIYQDNIDRYGSATEVPVGADDLLGLKADEQYLAMIDSRNYNERHRDEEF